MRVLKILEKIQIVVTEENLNDKREKFHIIYQNRIYEGWGSFNCITDGWQDKNLYSNLKYDFMDALDDTKQEFKRIIASEQKDSTFANELQSMMLKVLAEQSTDKILEIARPMLDSHIKETYGSLPQMFEVKTPKATFNGKGVVHEKFDDVLQLVNLDIPVYLEGPAGTGKNVICKQIADSMDLKFYFTNAVTQEYKLTGFIDANGTYQETQFYKAFKDGGLFFLDEMDASIPEVLIILNAALANGYFDFPVGKIEAHEDFRVIAAGNTVGQGASLEYSGRYQLDGASLDRFAIIHIDYSLAIETALAQGDEELLNFIHNFREVTKDYGIFCICSYRTIERIKKLEDVFDLSKVIKISLLKGLNDDDIRILKNNLDENKYSLAM